MNETPCSPSPGSLRPERILREIQINLLECKVCFERFSTRQSEHRPQNLSCGHVLCLECVRALSHPVLKKLECPFCRQLCNVDSTSHCQALTDLHDLLLCQSPGSLVPLGAKAEKKRDSGECHSYGPPQLVSAFGAWGTLVNPTGIAVFGSSGTIVVVHDGDKRVMVFSSQGKKLHSFGRRGREQAEICYPLDVAVSPSGHVVVTDAGDKSVKVFASRGSHVLTVKGPLQLPWGVDIDGNGNILISDVQAGTLSRVSVDYTRGVTLTHQTPITDLQHPRAVACCHVQGNIAVVEHLFDGTPSGNHHPTRLRVFGKDFKLLHQIDSFSLSLGSAIRLTMSGVAFDQNENLIIVDSMQGMIWGLGKLQNGPALTPLVGEHLVHPVALSAAKSNTLIVLDSGDHTVKIYSSKSQVMI